MLCVYIIKGVFQHFPLMTVGFYQTLFRVVECSSVLELLENDMDEIEIIS